MLTEDFSDSILNSLFQIGKANFFTLLAVEIDMSNDEKDVIESEGSSVEKILYAKLCRLEQALDGLATQLAQSKEKEVGITVFEDGNKECTHYYQCYRGRCPNSVFGQGSSNNKAVGVFTIQCEHVVSR